jgi:hypothetical protein
MEEIIRESRSAQDSRDHDPRLFQPGVENASNSKVFEHGFTQTLDLRVAISMENRYFTSAFNSRS